MDELLGPLTFVFAVIVSIGAVVVLCRQMRSEGHKVVDNNSAKVAVEVLIDLGYDRDDAQNRVSKALCQEPDGDESVLVNIAIRL